MFQHVLNYLGHLKINGCLLVVDIIGCHMISSSLFYSESRLLHALSVYACVCVCVCVCMYARPSDRVALVYSDMFRCVGSFAQLNQ